MWRDICLANRAALLDEIDAFGESLGALREAVAHADGARMERIFGNARSSRDAWLKSIEDAK